MFRPTLEDVEQLASFRLMLEVGALERCLAGNAAAAQAAMQAARAEGDGKAYARADTAFHAVFFAHCGNVHLANAYRGISGQVAALRAHLSVPRSDQQDLSFAEHAEMIEAFAARDLRRLSALLNDHILRALSVYAGALRG